MQRSQNQPHKTEQHETSSTPPYHQHTSNMMFRTTSPSTASLNSAGSKNGTATSSNAATAAAAATNHNPQRKNPSGSETQFPGKLHHMMFYVESMNLEHIICWVNDGKAFLVRDSKKLTELLPIFFSQTKYRSFRRQLNMWHFERLVEGPYKGAFQHPYFLRDNKMLCRQMSRDINRNPWKKELQIQQQAMSLAEAIPGFRTTMTTASDTFLRNNTNTSATTTTTTTSNNEEQDDHDEEGEATTPHSSSTRDKTLFTIESALETAEEMFSDAESTTSNGGGSSANDDDDTIISLPQASTMDVFFDITGIILPQQKYHYQQLLQQPCTFKDGDCVGFEGRSFHFVDYYDPTTNTIDTTTTTPTTPTTTTATNQFPSFDTYQQQPEEKLTISTTTSTTTSLLEQRRQQQQQQQQQHLQRQCSGGGDRSSSPRSSTKLYHSLPSSIWRGGII